MMPSRYFDALDSGLPRKAATLNFQQCERIAWLRQPVVDDELLVTGDNVQASLGRRCGHETFTGYTRARMVIDRPQILPSHYIDLSFSLAANCQMATPSLSYDAHNGVRVPVD